MNTFFSEVEGKKVSIIINCYNQAKYVAGAIESALNQTYKNVEILVVNDASTDRSAEIIQSYANKNIKVIFLNEKVNKGVLKSRDFAISKSSGDYVLPVDADDKIDPTFCEKAVKILDSDLDVRIVYLQNENNLETAIFDMTMYRKSDLLMFESREAGLTDLCSSVLNIFLKNKKSLHRLVEKLNY